MKKQFFKIAILLFITTMGMSQAPQAVKYQAVIRDNTNALVSNQNIGLQISILQGGPSGTLVYQETFSETTNANGMIFINIGQGTATTGIFAEVDWANGPYFMETAVDIAGGTSYAVLGTSELLSVPYALYSDKANHAVYADSAGQVDSANYAGRAGHAIYADSTGQVDSANYAGHASHADTADYVVNMVGDNYYFQANRDLAVQQISGTQYREIINFAARVLDPSNSYNRTTSTFTAPADGIYFFSSFVTVKSNSANSGGAFFGYLVNNAPFPDPSMVPMTIVSPAMYLNETVIPISGLINLNAGDTVRVGIIGADNGEAFTVSYSSFSGYKIR